MSCPYGLTLLEVRISGEDHLHGFTRPIQQGTLDLSQGIPDGLRGLHAPQPKIGRHLVIA